jgi:CRP-like cAMP-binding protein
MNLNPLWGNPFVKKVLGVNEDVVFLSSVTVFDLLNTRQKQKVLSILHTRLFEPGEIVFRKGDPGVGMYVIRNGGVEIYNEFSDMTKRKIIDLGVGDFFGEMSLLNDSPRSATVISTSKSTLLGLFRHDLLELMNSDPSLGVKLVYRLAQIVSERLRHMNEFVEE